MDVIVGKDLQKILQNDILYQLNQLYSSINDISTFFTPFIMSFHFVINKLFEYLRFLILK